MKSIMNLAGLAKSRTLLADEVIEFHAARLLLLISICGTDGRINGLTKMAKLDFFVRYPKFFVIACQSIGKEVREDSDSIESNMVRYHYGPWDNRYYHVLAYIEARRLIDVKKEGNSFYLSLTELGKDLAVQFEKESSYLPIIKQMQLVKQALGNMKGTQLKNLIYKVFDQQIAQLSLGEVIK